MSSDVASELTSAIQSTHIIHHPDPARDINPSTAASRKIPVRLKSSDKTIDFQSPDDDEIPLSVLEPVPRQRNLPPLPDMRFEQSYLARIKPYTGDPNTTPPTPPDYLRIAWVTIFDQVLMPLSQGIVWNLLIYGWRTWNTAARFRGRGTGAKLRRWWWGVNNWKLPEPSREQKIAEWYQAQGSTSQGD